jgi:hypothetical protein
MSQKDRVEWRIAFVDRMTGQYRFHTEGAQAVFSLSSGRKVVKALGPGWALYHQDTAVKAPEK